MVAGSIFHKRVNSDTMVSIIIPTVDRCDQLERTLVHISQLTTHPHLFEIVVIDNGSKDGTKDIVTRFIHIHPELTVRYIFDPMPGLLTGRHRGAREANGDILTFIDDDVHVTENWLDAIISTLKKHPNVMLLTGPCLPFYESEPPLWVNYLWQADAAGISCGWYSLLDFGAEEKEIDPNFVWGLNFTIRRVALDLVNGFHPDNLPSRLQMYQGDGETGLTIKAVEKGLIALYNPDVKLYHEVPTDRLTIDYLKKRAFYQGVANSFTQIRYDFGLYNPQNRNRLSTKRTFLKRIKRVIKKTMQFMGILKPHIQKEASNFLDLLRIEEENGFNFHQAAFQQNEDVRMWVLKDNFLNYNLPIQ